VQMATYSEGLNGVKILVPSNWITANGRDGSRIAFPPGWTSTEGRAGKRIPIPPGWLWAENIQGRKIPLPPGWLWRETPEGARIPIPPSAQSTQGYAGNTLVVEAGNRKITIGAYEVTILENGMLISGNGGVVWVGY
jgi:hypothetical protein